MKNKSSSDLKLIKRARNSDSLALKELVDKYGAIYDSIINRMNFQNVYTKKDMIDDKLLFFFETAKTFNPNKNTKFSTYVYNMTRWTCLDKLKDDRRKYEALKLDILTPEFDSSKISHIIDKIKTFEERAQYIFANRFFERKKTFSQIGKDLNLTYEGVRQIYLKHIEILKKTNE